VSSGMFLKSSKYEFDVFSHGPLHSEDFRVDLNYTLFYLIIQLWLFDHFHFLFERNHFIFIFLFFDLLNRIFDFLF